MSEYTPERMPILVKIGGVDVGAHLNLQQNSERQLQRSLIEQEMGEVYDTLSLALKNAGSLGIEHWQEVVVSNPAESQFYFGGYITAINDQDFATELDMVCTVTDYTIKLEKSLINLRWEDAEDTEILADLRTACEPPLTDFDFSTYVSNLGSVPNFPARRMTVREALDRLALLMGANWYIDYEKQLHWFAEADIEAEFSLSDAPDYINNFPYQSFRKVSNGIETLNRLTVVGGHFLSANLTDTYGNDGEQVRLSVPVSYHKQSGETGVIVEVNTGTDVSPVWTAQTVGVKYIDSLDDFDVLFAFSEKYFEFATAPGNLTKAWRVKGRYEAPLRVRVRNMESYDRYGIWLDGVEYNNKLEDKETAKLFGLKKLKQVALGRVRYKVETDTPGLRAGMVVRVVNAKRGVDEEFLIQRLKRRFVGGGWVRDTLELGDYFPDLYRMIGELARRTIQDVDYEEDEILDELLQFYDEFGFIGETTDLTTSAGPYTWGPGGSNDFTWGFGKYS